MKRDPYEVLGVNRYCSDEVLREAWLYQCKKHHPDENQGNSGASEEAFKEAADAYRQIMKERALGRESFASFEETNVGTGMVVRKRFLEKKSTGKKAGMFFLGVAAASVVFLSVSLFSQNNKKSSGEMPSGIRETEDHSFGEFISETDSVMEEDKPEKQEMNDADAETAALFDEADRLIGEKKFESAGPLLIEAVSDKDYLAGHMTKYTIGKEEDGCFTVQGKKYEYATQYWDQGSDGYSARVSFYYREPLAEPEFFSYRFSKEQEMMFVTYDMNGNYIEHWGTY